MRHKFGYKKLNRTSEHRKALIKNMLNSLIKIRTNNYHFTQGKSFKTTSR